MSDDFDPGSAGTWEAISRRTPTGADIYIRHTPTGDNT